MLFTKLILMDESMIFSKLLHKILFQLAKSIVTKTTDAKYLTRIAEQLEEIQRKDN